MHSTLFAWLAVIVIIAGLVGLIATRLARRKQAVLAVSEVSEPELPAAVEDDLRSLLRRARLSEQNLFRLEAAPLDDLGREFDEIHQMSKVVGVEVSQVEMVVKTETLYCVDPHSGLRHSVGAFKIRIPTSGGAAIRWHNQTRQVDGKDAPHVYSGGGVACLGTADYPIGEAFAKREFATVVQLAIQFIESVNKDDPYGKGIDRWPLAWPFRNPFKTRKSKGKDRIGKEYKQSRENYIRACSQRKQELLNVARVETVSRRTKLVQLEEAHFQKLRAAFLQSRGLSADLATYELEPELQRLRELSHVAKVHVGNGKILVSTDTLCATSPVTGKHHKLGEFLIEFPLQNFQGGIRWFNNTCRVNAICSGMNTPYVFADGSACADDIRETFIELLAQCELAMAAELAIQFVLTVKDDQMGKYIDKWPQVAAQESGQECLV